MPTISNKTQKPLSVPLPGGKTLYLGPGKTGQITARAVENARVKKLVDAGEIEVAGDDARATAAAGGGKRGRTAFYGPTASSAIRRTGDR